MGFDPNHYSSIKSASLENDVMFCIIHISNISKSLLNQLDDWNEFENPNAVSVDRLKRGGQKVIREVNLDDAAINVTTLDKYKLLLRDDNDTYCYAYELDHPLGFLRDSSYHESPLPMRLGGKLIVKKGTPILSGVLMLSNKNCQYLGIDVDDDLVQRLNNGIIRKYIDLINKQLRG